MFEDAAYELGALLLRMGVDTSDLIIQLSEAEKQARAGAERIAAALARGGKEAVASLQKSAPAEFALFKRLEEHYKKLGLIGVDAYKVIASGAYASAEASRKFIDAAREEEAAMRRRSAVLKVQAEQDKAVLEGTLKREKDLADLRKKIEDDATRRRQVFAKGEIDRGEQALKPIQAAEYTKSLKTVQAASELLSESQKNVRKNAEATTLALRRAGDVATSSFKGTQATLADLNSKVTANLDAVGKTVAAAAKAKSEADAVVKVRERINILEAKAAESLSRAQTSGSAVAMNKALAQAEAVANAKKRLETDFERHAFKSQTAVLSHIQQVYAQELAAARAKYAEKMRLEAMEAANRKRLQDFLNTSQRTGGGGIVPPPTIPPLGSANGPTGPGGPGGTDWVEQHRRLTQFHNKLNEISQGLREFGRRWTFGFTVPVVGGLTAMTKLTGELEVQRGGLTRLLGSVDAANKMIGDLRELTLKSPMKFDDALTGARRLIALNFQAGEVNRTLRILGDTITATGGDTSTMERIIKAMADVKAAGRLQAQEVLQFKNASINAISLVADHMGITTQEVLKKMKDGLIDADTAIEGILSGLDRKFKGTMEDRTKTLFGNIDRLKKKVEFAIQDLGETQLNNLKEITKSLENVIDSAVAFLKWFAMLPPEVQKLALGLLALTAAIGPLAWALGNIGGAAAGAIKVIRGVTGALLGTGGLGAALSAMTPTAWAALGVGVAAAATYGIFKIQTMQAELDKTQQKFEAWNRKLAQMPRLSMNKSPEEQGFMWDEKNGSWEFDPAKNLDPILKKGGIKIIKPPASSEDSEAEKKLADMYAAFGVKDLKADVDQLESHMKRALETMSPQQLTLAYQTLHKTIVEAGKVGVLTAGQVKEKIDQWFAAVDKAGADWEFDTNKQLKMPPGMNMSLEEYKQLKDAHDSRVKDMAKERRDALKAIEDNRLMWEEYAEILLGLRDVTNSEAGALLVLESSLDRVTTGVEQTNEALKIGEDVLRNYNAAMNFDQPGFQTPEFIKNMRRMEDAFKAFGIEDTVAKYKLLRQEFKFLNEHAQELGISTRALKQAELELLKAYVEAGGQMTTTEQKRYRQLQKELGGVKALEEAYKRFGRQVSTILTDFGRSVIEILIPKPTNNQKQETGGLSSEVTGAFNSAFKDLAAKGYADPVRALDEVIKKIREAGTVSEANAIAVRHFGDMGPIIAKGLRDGSISAQDLAKSLAEATNVLHEHVEEQEKKVSKIKQLWHEVKVSILRAMVEEGANAVAKFTGGALKNLLNSLDGILMKIPLIGRALANIGGNTAANSIPGIQIPGGSIPVSQIPNPPTQPPISVPAPPTGPGKPPSTPAPSPGGSGGGGLGVAGVTNMVTGIVSAIADGITAVMQFRIEGTLNQIERNTAAGSIHLLNILTQANEYWPYIKGLHSYMFELQLATLREIRDVCKNFIGVSLNVSPTAEQQERLIAAGVERLLTTDSTTGDRLLDIHFAVNRVREAVNDNRIQVVAAVNGFRDLAIPQLRALQKSLLEKILGGANALNGIGGIIGNVASGFFGGIGGALGSIGTAVFGDRKEGSLNGIEHNTRYSMMYLGERSDGGILGQTFRIADNTEWTMKGVDTIGQTLWKIYDKIPGVDALQRIPQAEVVENKAALSGTVQKTAGPAVSTSVVDPVRPVSPTVAPIVPGAVVALGDAIRRVRQGLFRDSDRLNSSELGQVFDRFQNNLLGMSATSLVNPTGAAIARGDTNIQTQYLGDHIEIGQIRIDGATTQSNRQALQHAGALVNALKRSGVQVPRGRNV